MKSSLNAKHLHNEKAAYAYVEARLWPKGPICPHCGEDKRCGALKGKSTRVGVYKCYACRKPFSVKVGTIFQASHIPLHIWLQAIVLMASSKKGMSANQFARVLGVTLKSAWFMAHRLREAMGDPDFGPLGGSGKIVEADETYIFQKEKVTKRTIRGKPSHSSKLSVVSLVERGGRVKSFHVDRADKPTVARIVMDNVARESKLYTDESWLYKGADAHVSEHSSVHHMAGEYERDGVHNNTVEGFFGVFKRGMRGTYQHCGERHLHRYLSEFDFRYNAREALGYNDEDRAAMLLQKVVGKRLTYETTGKKAHAKESQGEEAR